MKVLRPLNLAAALALLPPSAMADHVILDDCIIDGSMCVGLDCVNGENFGFDTIRMKENNLRFHFDDTSVAASFPPNDWRFIANDSANGGGSYLAIEDATAGRIPFRVLAGAGNHSLYIDSQGDVGLGTNNPILELHIVDGDTPTVRLEQDGSSGWNPQTWDVAGNETNFFIRDVTHGSKLPFRIRPDAPSNSLEIEADGEGDGPALGADRFDQPRGRQPPARGEPGERTTPTTWWSPTSARWASAPPRWTRWRKLQIVHALPQAMRFETSAGDGSVNFMAWYDTGGRTGLLGHAPQQLRRGAVAGQRGGRRPGALGGLPSRHLDFSTRPRAT